MADEKTPETPQIDAGNSLIQKRGQTADEAEIAPRQGTYSDVATHLPEAGDIEAGDPGTYAGEYKPAPTDEDEDVDQRDDLPEGYVPGSYAGEYTPFNKS